MKGWVSLILSILLCQTSYTSEKFCSEWGLWWEMLPSKGFLQKHLYYHKNNPIPRQLYNAPHLKQTKNYIIKEVHSSMGTRQIGILFLTFPLWTPSFLKPFNPPGSNLRFHCIPLHLVILSPPPFSSWQFLSLALFLMTMTILKPSGRYFILFPSIWICLMFPSD